MARFRSDASHQAEALLLGDVEMTAYAAAKHVRISPGAIQGAQWYITLMEHRKKFCKNCGEPIEVGDG